MTFLISLLKLYIADIGLLEYDAIHLVYWYLPIFMLVPYARRLEYSSARLYVNLKSHIIQNILIELIQCMH
jgi:hypothetical protein